MRESQPGQMRSGAIVNRHGKIGGHLHQISLDVCCRHLLQGEAQSQQTFRGEVFCSSNNNSITINNNTRTTTATTTITTTSTKVHADSLGQSGEESKRNVELPAQKQFLMARRVPCTAAASAATLFTEKLAEDGWVETESTQKAGSTVEAKAAAEEEDDEEVVDIDDFDYSQAAAEDDSVRLATMLLLIGKCANSRCCCLASCGSSGCNHCHPQLRCHCDIRPLLSDSSRVLGGV
eukprot:m.400229 g.400229  ORF g.400229 m.400229 type:complete len:235 (-) comp56439_c0_seq19:459-1163(-)